MIWCKVSRAHSPSTDGRKRPDVPTRRTQTNLSTRGQNRPLEVVTARITLDKGKGNSVFHRDGTSVVIHAGKDDYKTDPAGNAGDRIACGVITEARETVGQPQR